MKTIVRPKLSGALWPQQKQRSFATSGRLQSEKSTRGLKNDKSNMSARLIGYSLLHSLKPVPVL